MTDWKSSQELAHDLLVAKYLCLICLGSIIIDFAHSLRFDYDLLFARSGTRQVSGSNSKIRWPQVCYFACKILYFPYWTVTFITGEPSYRIDCQTTITLSEVLMGIITCLCSALLSFRVLCIWQHRCGKVCKGGMLLLWLGLLGVWMAGVPDVTGSWVTGIGSPWVEDRGACWFDPIPFRYAGKFVATVAFDSLILLLTVVGVKEARVKTRLGAILMEQGTIYVVLTVAVNVLLVSFAWSDLNDIMTVILSIPAQTISVMTATRLYVLLRQETAIAHSPYGNSTSLPSLLGPHQLVPSGSSSSFPTYVIKGSSLRPKPSLPDTSSHCKSPIDIAVLDEMPPKVKKFKSINKLSYDERDPFSAKRPNTSPASAQRHYHVNTGPAVFIKETCSVVSEPVPAHLRGLYLSSGQAFTGILKH